jgi:predicted RNase H-like nuclease (RuvC/YqgF family)
MKIIFFIIATMISLASVSQEYPKIELNKRGEKLVVFTLEQAQKIDNDLEILSLLEKSSIQCDSLNLSNARTIEAQARQIEFLDKGIMSLEEQVKDKDLQIENISTRFKNLEKNNKICDEQKTIKERQISKLKLDLKKEKAKSWLLGGSGIAIGILAILIIR